VANLAGVAGVETVIKEACCLAPEETGRGASGATPAAIVSTWGGLGAGGGAAAVACTAYTRLKI
jgi:hypothetical protein